MSGHVTSSRYLLCNTDNLIVFIYAILLSISSSFYTYTTLKRLCIFGPKGAIQIRYYYYYSMEIYHFMVQQVLMRSANFHYTAIYYNFC